MCFVCVVLFSLHQCLCIVICIHRNKKNEALYLRQLASIFDRPLPNVAKGHPRTHTHRTGNVSWRAELITYVGFTSRDPPRPWDGLELLLVLQFFVSRVLCYRDQGARCATSGWRRNSLLFSQNRPWPFTFSQNLSVQYVRSVFGGFFCCYFHIHSNTWRRLVTLGRLAKKEIRYLD